MEMGSLVEMANGDGWIVVGDEDGIKWRCRGR